MVSADAEAYGAVAHVGASRVFRRVVVEVDDVVEHAERASDHARDELMVELPIYDELLEVQGAEIAHRGLVRGVVQGDFRAEVAVMHDADMVLWRADVRRVLPRNPWMSGFKEHAYH